MYVISIYDVDLLHCYLFDFVAAPLGGNIEDREPILPGILRVIDVVFGVIDDGEEKRKCSGGVCVQRT